MNSEHGPSLVGEPALQAMRRLLSARAKAHAEREEKIKAAVKDTFAPFHEAFAEELSKAGLPRDEESLSKSLEPVATLGAGPQQESDLLTATYLPALLAAIAKTGLGPEHLIRLLADIEQVPASVFRPEGLLGATGCAEAELSPAANGDTESG